MNSLPGTATLLIGAALPCSGWQSCEVVVPNLAAAANDAPAARSVWLLGLGSVVVWGLFASPRRPVL